MSAGFYEVLLATVDYFPIGGNSAGVVIVEEWDHTVNKARRAMTRHGLAEDASIGSEIRTDEHGIVG